MGKMGKMGKRRRVILNAKMRLRFNTENVDSPNNYARRHGSGYLHTLDTG